jgi:hypothetical protein
MSEHPPIHEARGVSYWDVELGEYILDPTPDINTRPPEEFRTKEFKSNPITTKVYG